MTEKTELSSESSIPPIEFLRECFLYEPETGKLFWKDRPLHHFPNEKAYKTFVSRGYIGKEFGKPFFQKTTKRVAGICGRLIYKGRGYGMLIHRIIWMMINGAIPEGAKIDHIDRDASNNKWTNLRLATHSQNLVNAADYRGRKNDLPRGVYKNGRKFMACTRKDGKLIYIGSFDTPELARAAYLEKASEVHGEFFKA